MNIAETYRLNRPRHQIAELHAAMELDLIHLRRERAVMGTLSARQSDAIGFLEGVVSILDGSTLHDRDEQCVVDPDTGLCRICGVARGDHPCPECGGWSFHRDHCTE